MVKKSPITQLKQTKRSSSSAHVSLGLRPQKVPYEVHTKQPSELVIGIVGPLGADNQKILAMITERLKIYQYTTKEILISKAVIPVLAGRNKVRTGTAYQNATELINLGNQIRKEACNEAILAIAAAAEIRRQRLDDDGVSKTAYIISSLKNPAEVAELRKIYGNGFYLFALHTDNSKRVENLTRRGMKPHEVWELITRDDNEPDGWGQHTRDTFHLADFFLSDENNDDKLKFSTHRCLDLIFGNPTITPTFNEFAMFMAFASAVRSADLSRQVGAVIARGSEILSTGANDCPSPGGGLYWPVFIGDRVDDVPRGRDYKRGWESNSREKIKLIEDITKLFSPHDQAEAQILLKRSRIKDITEYGRVVHAEMEALLACARNNLSCVGATLYSSTFPCHNCAKHIIAAGISQVIYIEPYPKSRAIEFHDDAITVEKVADNEKRVRFKPFIGVGPRTFFDLFSLALSTGRRIDRKIESGSDEGRAVEWNPSEATPRLQMLTVAHRELEISAEDYLKKVMYIKKGKV